MEDFLEALADSAADVAGLARASLVTVVHQRQGVGSGILWASGWVVTNAHVAQIGRAHV